MGLSQRARAWTALLLPWLAWFSFQQGLQMLLRLRCGESGIGLIWGVGSLALCLLAARVAWPLTRGAATMTHPWMARLALLGAVFFGLAIGFQTLAVAMVPPCVS